MKDEAVSTAPPDPMIAAKARRTQRADLTERNTPKEPAAFIAPNERAFS
jgi:hypothetical protein